MAKEINAKEIAEALGVSAQFVNDVFHEVFKQTIENGRVEITGFCSFKVDEDLRPTEVGGSATKTVKDINFRLSKQFKEALNAHVDSQAQTVTTDAQVVETTQAEAVVTFDGQIPETNEAVVIDTKNFKKGGF